MLHQYLKEYDQSVAELNQALELGYKPIDVYRIRAYVHYERKDFPRRVLTSARR
jgi:hypothetical protein